MKICIVLALLVGALAKTGHAEPSFCRGEALMESVSAPADSLRNSANEHLDSLAQRLDSGFTGSAARENNLPAAVLQAQVDGASLGNILASAGLPALGNAGLGNILDSAGFPDLGSAGLGNIIDGAGIPDLGSAGLGNILASAGLSWGIPDPTSSLQTRANDRIGSLMQRLDRGLTGSLALGHALQVAVQMPLAVPRSQLGGTGLMIPDLSSARLGDVLVTARLHLLGRGMKIAFVPVLSLPAGGSDGFVGERSPSIASTLAISRVRGRLRLDANLGYGRRGTSQGHDLAVKDELYARVAASYRSAPSGKPGLALDVALDAANNEGIEVLANGSYSSELSVVGFLEGGASMNESTGTSDWRLLIGVRYVGRN